MSIIWIEKGELANKKYKSIKFEIVYKKWAKLDEYTQELVNEPLWFNGL